MTAVAPPPTAAGAGDIVYVHPGRLYVGRGDERITTILGSCVAVCLHDAAARVGGLNHFLLPSAPHDAETSTRYAKPAIEALIERMLAEGARASRLQARVIGGARVLAAFGDDSCHLGLRNVAAANELLARHRIRVLATHVGGDRGRKLCFVPRDGAHFVELLGA